MVNYKWKASFILNGACCEQPFTKGDWTVESVPSNDSLSKIKLSKCFEETICKEYWEVYKQIENEIDKLLNAVISGLLFNANMNSFPTVSDIELKLVNPTEIIGTGQEIPTRTTFLFHFTLGFNEKDFDATLTNLATIEASPNKDVIYHCLHLFRQALSYSDSSDKFFALWRTFNALYNHYSPNQHESTIIKGALNMLSTPQVDLIVKEFTNVTSEELKFILLGHQSNLFKYLVNAALVDDYHHDRSQELQSALNSGIGKDIVESATFCFYVLRCKYAHGSDQAIIQNENMFKAGSYYLSLLLSILLNKLAQQAHP